MSTHGSAGRDLESVSHHQQTHFGHLFATIILSTVLRICCDHDLAWAIELILGMVFRMSVVLLSSLCVYWYTG
jgi:hypothetical protein